MGFHGRTMSWFFVFALALGTVAPEAWSAQDPSAQKPSVPGTTQAAPSVLYGVVRSAKDQNKLSGVPIRLENSSSGQVIIKESDQQGAFIFSDLAPGDYKIRVGGGKFSIQQKEGLLKAGTVGEMNFAVNALSQGNSSIIGAIFEGKGSNKIPIGAQVAIENVKTKEVYQVTTDKTGLFHLEGIPSGRYLVQATRKGYLPFTQEIAVAGLTHEDIQLQPNSLAEANIEAQGNKKIHDTTGAISIVGQKKFQQNLTTGATYTLMQNTPGIEYYSRSGGEGISGGMNFMSCRGYTVGGANTSPVGTAGIEVSVEGVPLNNEADGGEIYDLGFMNTDVKSAEVQRGVTTSRQTGSYAAGCAINFTLKDPTPDAYQKITSGGGSYGLYYTSYINNSGLSDSGWGGYNDFTILHQDGFQEFTPLTEYQYYGNLTKYLTKGKIYFVATANYKNYDRGASVTVDNYNTFGPTFNGGPSFSNPSNGATTPNAPFYKNWSYGRFLLDLGFKNQITPDLRVTNSLYVVAEPNGDTSMPVGFSGGANIPVTPNTQAMNISPNYSNQLGYQFTQNYYQAQGFKAGDIAEVKYHLFYGDDVYLGMKGQYATYQYFIMPLSFANQVGGTINANYSQTSIVGYLEDHYQPVKQMLLNVGFRVASIAQYFNDQVPLDQQANYKSSQVGPSSGGSMLVPMPHAGLNIYPTDNWKLYVNGGESFAPPAIFAYKGAGPGGVPGGVSPETVWDLSAGVRYTWKKGYVAGDVFSDYLSNMPVPVVFGSGSTQYTQFENIAEARQQGIELEGKYTLGWGFGLEGNFTYIQGVFGNTPVNGPGTQPNFEGDLIPYIPMDMANIALSYDHGPWHFLVDERFTGVMNIIDFSGGNSGTGNFQQLVPAYWVTDLHASYDLPVLKGWYKKADVAVDAYNLLNTNYYNPAGLSPYNSVETLFVYPGEPVNVFASLNLTF